ncbi:bifunctional diguanylate cyclase/phosphodiesterase [Aestuariispira insulae]|uniref:Diguanylate cyclase/phosphodiesterase /diguanylate cyclase/phosphodiesterase with GAF sensor n=1 Tax=Aestuariispira insulae TaxID=1461337 RepID=A0A3D9HXQ3_9PROT|nr:EAL domain-containing protein [Aestuariispira insulae]RED54287.1 diguanylate cyclase/phosphodiesterase /diguanylate cyclase/phosphodiesterase with GAF sensor [Aestuariispira insulae]
MITHDDIWEEARVSALHNLQLLDTPAEARFDRVVQLARTIFQVPIALVSLVDSDRQWFKAHCGLEARQTPRKVSFCNHAIKTPSQIFIVENALEDPRFCDNPLVLGPPDIRFYAGAVLSTIDGFPIGTLCIIDTKPRIFDENDQTKLREMAGFISAELIMTPETEAGRQLARVTSGLDPVTSLYDSDSFKRQLANLREVMDTNSQFNLIAIQLPFLFSLKQRFNVQTADLVLIELCSRIQKELAAYGYVAGRIGPDTLAFLISGGTAVEEGLMDLINEKLLDPVSTSTGQIAPKARVELFEYHPYHQDANDLMLMVDKVFSQSEETYSSLPASLQVHSALKLARTLEQAMAEGQIKMYYQPKVCIETDRVRGFEALIRWWDEDGSPIPPPATIQAAEDSGLLEELTLWTLKETMGALHRWVERFSPPEPFSVAVNIPPRFIQSEQFVDTAIDLRERYELPFGYLEFEILENRLINDDPITIRNIDRLVEAGIDLAVDDFGTGYGSLTYLSKLPLKTLKIDRSFIKTLSGDPTSDFLTRSVIGMALNADLNAVAEGVETLEQLTLLKEMGCQIAQGFLYAPAVSEEVATTFLEHGIQPGAETS